MASVRVLVVEDQEDARELLELWGATVSTATNVDEALAQVDEQDIVLSDLGLPDVDGYELARRLQEHPRRKAMRLLAVTGFPRDEVRALALAAGFDTVLSKGLMLEELEELIRAAVVTK